MNKKIVGLKGESMKPLMSYHWPGNVRELENVIKRAIIICKGSEILPEDLPEQILSVQDLKHQISGGLPGDFGQLLDQLFEKVIMTIKDNRELDAMSILEKELIERAIRRTSGNKVQAAVLLGINRNTLRNKMERYHIEENETSADG